MSTQVQFRRGTSSQNNSFTGAVGEITVDTDAKTLRVHDGSTPGGSAVPTLNGTQSFTNKTHGSGSVWNGTAIPLGYGGTGSALSANAGAIAYSGASGFGLTAAGTSGQVLTSAGTGIPAWLSQSSLTVGNATLANTSTNIAGGSAGQLVYQTASSTSGFITAGATGTFLQSTGASTAPTWAAGQVTYGSTTVALGATSTTLAGLTAIDSTSGATSFFASPTTANLFLSASTINIGNNTFGGIASNTTFIYSTGTSISGAATYTGVSQTTTSGSGVGATFTVVKSGSGTYYASNFAGGNATISNIQASSGSGPWTATLSGLTSTAGFVVGGPITASNGTGTLAGSSPTSVVVASIVSGTSITYTQTGGTTPIVGTVTAVTQTGNTTITYNSGAIGSGYKLADTITIGGALLGGATPANNLTFTLATAINATGATINFNASTVNSNSTTIALYNTGVTTVNKFGAATAITIGAATGTFTVNNAAFVHNSTGATKVAVGTITQRPTGAIGLIRYNSEISSYEGYASGNWSSLGGVKAVNGFTYILAETAAAAANGDLDFYAQNAGVTAATQVGQWNRTNLKDYTGTIVGTQTTQNVFNTTATTVNAFGAATTLAIGASAGTLTLPGTIIGSNTTQNVYNTVATTVNAFGAATTINIGSSATGATATFAKNVTISGNLTVTGTTTTSSSASLTVSDSAVYVNTGATGNTKDIGLIGTYVATGTKYSGLLKNYTDGVWKFYTTATAPTAGSTQSFSGATYDSIRIGTVIYSGSTSGTTTLQASATAGTTTLTLPAATDTLVGLATTDTLTNKTISSGVLTGTLTAGGGVGTNGQFLQSTSTGVQWATVSGAIALASGSGSGTVSTGGTLTFTGGTGVSTSASGSTVTFAIGQSVATGANFQINSLGVNTAGSGTAGEIRATNAITSFYSDERLKTRSGNIQNALEKVLSLDGFHYTANETAVALGYDASRKEVGLSAQQVQAVMPEIVVPAPIDEQYLTIHYERMVPLLVEAIKEQQKQIEELKAKLGM